jgi:uncharacterized membrane protein YkgB
MMYLLYHLYMDWVLAIMPLIAESNFLSFIFDDAVRYWPFNSKSESEVENV